MTKIIFFILSLNLLKLALCRVVPDQKLCEREYMRFHGCLMAHIGGAEVTQEDPYQMTPVSVQNFKRAMSCVGNLHCNGDIKHMKYVLESRIFVFEQASKAKCGKHNFHEIIDKCTRSDACEAEIVETSQSCTAQEQLALYRAVKAQRDQRQHMHQERDTNIGWMLTFDSSKYD